MIPDQEAKILYASQPKKKKKKHRNNIVKFKKYFKNLIHITENLFKKLSINGDGSYGRKTEKMVWREIDSEKEEGMMSSWNRCWYRTAKAQSPGRDNRGKVMGQVDSSGRTIV